GEIACLNPIGGPLGEDQLHDRLAPSGGGDGSALVVGVATAADQRGIAEASGSLVQRATGGCGGGDVAVAVECDGADGVVRDGHIVRGGREEIVAVVFRSILLGVTLRGLIGAQALD